MNNYYSLLIFTLTMLVSTSIIAQRGQGNGRGEGRGGRGGGDPTKGGIVGIIKSSETFDVVEFANVLLYANGDSTMLKGVVTNAEGRFFFRGLEFGSYDIVVDYIGHENKKIKDVTISADARRNRVGEIIIAPAANNLVEVEVKAEREMMEFALDKKVFNVDKNIAASGGNAEDVIKNIPSVTVDIDGNISLRGSENVTILVNGKPSALTGLDRRAILDQIPANTIKSIEVMTNPSAKYSPDGMAGIINIVTKNLNRKGFNLKTSLNLGTWNQIDGSIMLNYGFKKFNVFTSYNARHGTRFRKSIRNRTTTFQDTSYQVYQLLQNTDGDRTRTNHTFKGGFDYRLNLRNTLSASVTYSLRDRSNLSLLKSNSLYDYEYFQRSNRDKVETDNGDVLEYSLNYLKTFEKEKQELLVAASYSSSSEKEIESFQEEISDLQLNSLEQIIQGSNSQDKNSNMLFQLDYTHPLKDNKRIETGLKSTLRHIDNDYQFNDFSFVTNTWAFNDEVSNRFIYDEQIHAAYVTFSDEFKKFSYQLGLRAEQAFTTSTQATTDQAFDNDYFQIYPSAHLTYSLTKQQKFQLSYSRRVNRPRYRTLNPFANFSDPLNIRIGNPQLQPEFVNSYELGFLQFWEKGTFNSSIFYKRTEGLLSRFVFEEDGILYRTWQNANNADSYGIELVGTYRPAKFWRMNANATFYRTVINGDNLENDLTNAGYLWMARFSNTWTVWKNLDLQLNGFYRSRGVSLQGEMQPFYSFDFGVSKSILKKKGKITFRISDIFNTRRFRINLAEDNYELDMEFRRQSRIAYIGFSYSLNPEKRKRGRGNRERRSGGGNGGGDDMDF